MCLKRFSMDVAPPQQTVYTKNRFYQVALGSNATVGAYDSNKEVNDTSCPTPPFAMCVTDKTYFNETWNLDTRYETWEDGVPGRGLQSLPFQIPQLKPFCPSNLT